MEPINGEALGGKMLEVEELRRFAECLSALGATYSGLAAWLKSRGITELPAEGMPTARRGMNYLSNFTSNVLSGFHEAMLEGRIRESPDEIVAKMLAGEALAKNLSGKVRGKKGRPAGTKRGTQEDDG
jgi:hypothetical protein